MPRLSRPYLLNLILLGAALILSVVVGSVWLAPAEIWQWLNGQGGQTAGTILLQLRLPRTLLVAITGAALAGSGAAYQGLFRNPLADPYLMGVAAGGGLGAILAMSIRWPYTLAGMMAVPVAAFAGALLSALLVYQLARRQGGASTASLILAGIAISSFATALTSFLMLNATGELRRALTWMMGGATLSGWLPVLAALPYVALGLGTLFTLGHALNVLQFGEEQAQQLGLPVARVRRLVVVAATLATAAAVSFAGVIGFVGLIVPHLVRLAWGPDYRHLLPLAAIGGASLLLLADVVARVAMAPQEIPVGIITALLGAPFFLWVLRSSKRGG
ncbi:MAG: iron ABC transporter permease [Longilinea sp.]|jgi:iron complex transport system permease protein|nr:iron ABC transporter permease [Longilinea sp.]HQF61390.1 iron ABC transporter permease [Anaerolineaceae bacterium]HQH85176.1 iron ABC transporter permease [Anaerolineaceae bacterium]